MELVEACDGTAVTKRSEVDSRRTPIHAEGNSCGSAAIHRGCQETYCSFLTSPCVTEGRLRLGGDLIRPVAVDQPGEGDGGVARELDAGVQKARLGVDEGATGQVPLVVNVAEDHA